MAMFKRGIDLVAMRSTIWRSMAISAASAITTKVKPTSEIPGLPRFPIVGSIPYLLTHKSFDNRRLHLFWAEMVKEFGPVIRMDRLGQCPIVGILNPDDIETLYRATMDNPIREAFLSLKKVREDAVNDYFDQKGGILIENNNEWWRVRSKMQTPMMRQKNIAIYLPEMDQVTLEFMERIEMLQDKFGEMPGNFQFELYKWALESVGLVALSRRMGCLDPNVAPDSNAMKLIMGANDIFDAMNDTEMSLQLWRYFPTPSYSKLKKSHALYLKVADEAIRETEATLTKEVLETDDAQEMPLMELLLKSDGLTHKDVVTIILDMLIAGIDTTSHTLGFTMYLLARNPKVQRKLQAEVDHVLGDGKGPITAHQLGQLSYTKLVVKESLRLFPLTIGNARNLEKDIVLGGYLVPKGWLVFTLNMLTSKEESVFPRAAEFVPERWGRDQPLGPIHPFASLPFSHGPRMCVGRRIAEQEIYTFLARLMHRFNVDYKYNDMGSVSRLVFTPSEPLKFNFTKRNK